MTDFIEGENRFQATLFPERLDDYITEDNAVRVIDVFIDDDLVTENDRRTVIDNKKLNPLSRLGGNHYALLGETVTIKRPN